MSEMMPFDFNLGDGVVVEKSLLFFHPNCLIRSDTVQCEPEKFIGRSINKSVVPLQTEQIANSWCSFGANAIDSM